VIGAGQAGLATSWYLTRRAADHVCFRQRPDRGKPGAAGGGSFCLVHTEQSVKLLAPAYQVPTRRIHVPGRAESPFSNLADSFAASCARFPRSGRCRKQRGRRPPGSGTSWSPAPPAGSNHGDVDAFNHPAANLNGGLSCARAEAQRRPGGRIGEYLLSVLRDAHDRRDARPVFSHRRRRPSRTWSSRRKAERIRIAAGKGMLQAGSVGLRAVEATYFAKLDPQPAVMDLRRGARPRACSRGVVARPGPDFNRLTSHAPARAGARSSSTSARTHMARTPSPVPNRDQNVGPRLLEMIDHLPPGTSPERGPTLVRRG